ncbi:MAG: PIG-L family deacetylase [Hyphomicrobiales bacterium]
MKLDVLVFGPHPDDAEIGAGGVLLKLKDLGHATGIIDMTRGDMGWGTPEERDRECADAAAILKLDVRENLDMGDHRIEDTFENRCRVAAAIRRHRPEIIFAPYYDIPPGRGLGHNDHGKTGILVSHAYNLAHLRKAPIEGEAYQAKALFYYFLPPGTRPTFLVDVSKYYDDWMRALECHRSQFSNPEKPRPGEGARTVSEYLDAVSRVNGWSVGAARAQPFLAAGPLRIGDPLDLVREIVPRP